MKTAIFIISFLIFTVNSKVWSQSLTSLIISDTRNINDLPNFSELSIKADFKLRDVIGVPGSGMYSTNLTFFPWVDTDNSGGKNHQLNLNDGGVFYRNAYPLDGQWGGWRKLLIADERGNVAIGTNVPLSKLTVAGSITIIGGLNNALPRPEVLSGTAEYGEIRGYSASGNDHDDGFLRLSAGGGTNSFVKSYIDLSGYSTMPDMNRNIVFGTDGVERMRIITNGNIGIGIKDPTNKLDVNGTIHSKEVKVDMIGWSDFVFKKDYNLPTLEEVEKHIAQKGHLENIPNEKEVLQNGISLGEMNAKLLQKIEELTLYAIEQEKKNNKQSLQIELLAKENVAFKVIYERLNKIEEKLK